MSRTKMRPVEPVVVVASTILLIAVITVLWKIYTPEPKSLTASNDYPATTLPATTQAATSKETVVLPQTATNFDAYKPRDPAKPIVGPNGQYTARLKSLPDGISAVSALFPASQATSTGPTTTGSVWYVGKEGQILVDTVKPAQAVSGSAVLGSQQITLKSGDKAGYDANLPGMFPTRFIIQHNNLLIVVNSTLVPDRLKSVLNDLTLD